MPKNKQKPSVIPAPPLHVELSAPAQAALAKIRSQFKWNKKTAVETALISLSQTKGAI